MLKHSLRGCADWNESGLPIKSTTSDEATKLYDCALNQLCGLYDDHNYGGLVKTLTDMKNADPDFVLGQCLVYALEMGGVATEINPELAKHVTNFIELADKNKNSYEVREVKHVEALKHLLNRDVESAIKVWEEILAEYPLDIHAIRLIHGYCFDFGFRTQMRDSIARVLSHWTGLGLPFEGYVHGMYAFGLEETNLFSKAESEANLALEINELDGWATHAMSHIHETLGLTEKGIEFLTKTENNWRKSNLFTCHNYWHLALHNIEEERYETALNIFDNEIIKTAETRGRIGNIVDASSLLYRLQIKELPSGVITDERWQRVYNVVKPHVPNPHILGFFDSHILMACLGSKHFETVEQMVEKVKEYDSNERGLKATKAIACALIEYNRENYAKCVDLLFDVKYHIQEMGGSNAQRDIFNKIMISAALKSSKDWHKKLAINLMNESKSFRP